MATKKDLIEAQSFSRRRLLTAFTSGAPAGKELEPAQPLRAVVAGIVLTAMVILGGVFYGIIRPGLPDGWQDNSLILVKDTGARYVAVDGTLHPVLNTASARLLMPAGEYRVITTDQDSIADIEIGATIGILGAPDDLPVASGLVADGWAACTVAGGTAVTIPSSPVAKPVTDAAVVTRGEDTFVVWRGLRYRVDPASLDPVLRAVGLDAASVRPVDGTWLNLLQPGDDLAPLVIAGAGDAVAGTDLVVGTAIHQQGTAEGDLFVVTSDGALARLTPLAYQLYLLGTGADLGTAREVATADVAGLSNAGDQAGGAGWPETVLAPLDDDDVPCAVLRHTPGGAEDTVLGVADADVELPTAGEVSVAVGAGALVTATDAEGAGVVHLVDETGTSFAIPGADGDLLGRLGYSSDDVSSVSGAWLQFLPAGPDLTIAAAGATPSSQQPPGSGTGSGPTPEPTDTAPASGVRADADPQQCAAGTEVFTPDAPVGLTILQSERAWRTATGVGVVVAVVDSGIDSGNKHLAGAVIGGVDLVGDGVGPYSDVAGHGTAIAGQIAARRIDESGVVGLAPDAQLLSVRVFRDSDSSTIDAGFGPTAERIAAGIRWAADNGARVVNVSLSDAAQVPVVTEAVAYATARGALVVASAGNRSTAADETDGPRYPAADSGALAVTASDTTGLVSDASIHGPHVAIAALGSDILTASTGGGDCIFATESSSSSYATAYASAAAALVAQAHPAETPAQWAYRLEATASRATPDARDDVNGWGVIQPAAAIALLPDPDLRGPVSPFFDSTGAPIGPQAVALTPQTGESPFGLTRETATLSAVGGAALLGTLGVIGVLRLRRRSDAAVAGAPAPAPRQGGLLTRPKPDAG